MSRKPGTGPDLTRRDFGRICALLGGCAATATAAVHLAHAIGPGRPDFGGRRTIFRSDYPLDDPEAVVMTTCLGCHGACPVRASREGEAVAKLDGNPWSPRVHPAGTPHDAEQAARLRGASCARGQARLQNTHDPHRLVQALQRDGRRGDGAFRAMSTSEARAALADGVEGGRGLAAVLAGGGRVDLAVDPRQLDRAPVLSALAATLPACRLHLGHPTPWLLDATTTLAGRPGWLLTPHWRRARAVLAWGADPLASGVDPVGDSIGIARFLEGAGHGPLVVVDPRLSEVAAKADVWLPVRPGGDEALAWMFIRAWQEEGVFEPPLSWRDTVLRRPWRDMELTAGLGREVVRHAARLLAAEGDGLAIRIGGGVGERGTGVHTTLAILRLAALSGASARGGAMEPVRQPAVLGERPVEALSRAFADGGTLDSLVVVGDGGITDSLHQATLLHALADPARVGQLVVVTTAMNPVAALADVVVPDVTEHERYGLVRRWDGTSLVRPVIPPVIAHDGLEGSWSRGFEGLLETLAEIGGTALDCDDVVRRAVAGTGFAHELSLRGWVPPPPAPELPTLDPFGPVTIRPPDLSPDALALITYREAFGGFVDSTAQYWSTPSLRETNEAWIHPETAAEIGADEHGTLEIHSTHHAAYAHALLTEAVRPGVIALAVGYGHAQGYDGHTTIDGVRVPADPRRRLGIDAGALVSAHDLGITAGGPAHGPSMAELLFPRGGSCDRI